MLAQEYPVSMVCEVLDCARSSYYHRPAPSHEHGLRQAIEEVAAAWTTYGYRRVTHQLRREGWTINHKPVARIMRERGLQAHRKHKRRNTTDSSHAFPRYPTAGGQKVEPGGRMKKGEAEVSKRQGGKSQ